jgi:tetratricopeptide (TPR) repeat protein
MADLSKAIALDPEYLFAFYDRGLLQARMGRPEQAITDLETAAQQCLDLGRVQVLRRRPISNPANSTVPRGRGGRLRMGSGIGQMGEREPGSQEWLNQSLGDGLGWDGDTLLGHNFATACSPGLSRLIAPTADEGF